MENLARYIIQASFSQERLTYVSEESKVVYQAKDGKEERVFDALEWPRQKAAGCEHSPPCLPVRVRTQTGAPMFQIRENQWCAITDITAHVSLNRKCHPKPALVRLVYLFSFRLCTIPNLTFRAYRTGDRSGPGNTERIEKILKHFGLWGIKVRTQPKANAPPVAPEYHIDYMDSRLPAIALAQA